MQSHRSFKQCTGVCRQAALLLAALLLLPGASRADFLTVSCPSGGPGQFPSITAALNALPVNSPTEPHGIQVTGNCVENVFIGNRQRIEIAAPPGQTATITAANPAAIVVHISGSRAIVLRRLIIQGGERGVLVNQFSEVSIDAATIQNNTNDGLGVQISSVLGLQSSTIQNNGGGLGVRSNSAATIGFAPAQTVRISNNRGNGIVVQSSYFQVNFGNLKLENNGQRALVMVGGSAQVFGNVGENLFQNNARGLLFVNGASARFDGKTTIRNNGEFGVENLASSITFSGNVLPDGTFNAAIIEGHSRLGANVLHNGNLTFNGPHKIRNNGTPGLSPVSGLRVRGGLLTLTGTEVTDNAAPGIEIEQNSTVDIDLNNTITGNAEEGLRLTKRAVARLGAGNTFKGNGKGSITCDGTSLLYGELSGIEDIRCDNIEPETQGAAPTSPEGVLPH